MKPLGRLKNIKGCGEWKRSFFKIGNWWEEMTEPISNKSARRKLKQQLKNKKLKQAQNPLLSAILC